jgi:hypothetical protein
LLLYFPALLALILSQISLGLEWIRCPDLSSISLSLGVSVGSQVRKGDSIAEFLRAVQHQLAAEFREIRTASVENLLYVKEDLIIPHQHSFYELIINKARGKSGPVSEENLQFLQNIL